MKFYVLTAFRVFGFLIAFSFMCYSSSDALVISLVTGAWFIVAILVLWCVAALASWDQRIDEPKSFWELVHSCLSFILFGLWWLAEEIVETLVRGFKLMLFSLRKTEQQPLEIQNARTSSIGTVVVEMW